jgi:hypothetical protein
MRQIFSGRDSLRITAQKRYTIAEREFSSYVETCKEYKNILLGYPIIVFSDYNNKTFNG